MRDYISISLVVQAYSANPEMVIQAIEDDTLINIVEQST
jgi:hypothetical protein